MGVGKGTQKFLNCSEHIGLHQLIAISSLFHKSVTSNYANISSISINAK